MKYSQESLVLHLRQGDSKAFQHLYTSYNRALLGAITRLVKDPFEAEDILQDTYLKAWQRFHYYDANLGSLYTWLLTIARNTALDALSRSRIVCVRLSTEPHETPVVKSYQPMPDTIGVRYMVEQMLTPKQWRVIDLAFWQGCTHEEIAEQLALPIGTVKTWIYKSLIGVADTVGVYPPPKVVNRLYTMSLAKSVCF